MTQQPPSPPLAGPRLEWGCCRQLSEVVWPLDVDAVLCQRRGQVLHGQGVFLVLLGGEESGRCWHPTAQGRATPPRCPLDCLLTLLLLRELPEAVPFILQCCRASLAMSEMNFCAAREIRRMLWSGSDRISLCGLPLSQLPPPTHTLTHMRGSEASKPARFK